MLHSLRARVRYWLAQRLFSGLHGGRVLWSQITGPGAIPLPWKGPNGEVVIVTLDHRGRMTQAPMMVRTPKEMLRALEFAPPVIVAPAPRSPLMS